MDTNVVFQMFSVVSPLGTIRRELVRGRFEVVTSNEIMLEYEEVVVRLSGLVRWREIERFFALLAEVNLNVVRMEPQYRYGLITVDPDDNKFVDCAITANADYIVTADKHFDILTTTRIRPQVIKPQTFADYLLSSGDPTSPP